VFIRVYSCLSIPVQTAVSKIKQLSRLRPKLALVLGSGFNHALRELDVDAEILYAKLPGFPKPGVAGHPGKLFIGWLGGTPVLVLSGRGHYYEGHTLEQVTFPIRVLAEFSIRDLLLTNAAGGINRRFCPGDFMCLTDHINFMGVNPLRGESPPGRPRFVDLTKTYDDRLNRLLKEAAHEKRLRLHSGVYLAVSGPSYETPAEIRAFARLGADAVGMSTVPEAIVARQCGMNVAAVSCITNLTAGRSDDSLSHEGVLKTMEKAKAMAASLLVSFTRLYGQNH